MAKLKETISKFYGEETNPFGQSGSASIFHLKTDPENTMLYPMNQRVNATTKYSGFPTGAVRAIELFTGGNRANNIAILADSSDIGFVDRDGGSVDIEDSDISNPSNTCLLEFNGGIYYGTEYPVTMKRFNMQTNSTTTLEVSGGTPGAPTISLASLDYDTVFGTVIPSVRAGVFAFNYSNNNGTGAVVYFVREYSDKYTTVNYVLTAGTTLTGTVTSVDAYKNYAVFLCTYKTGSIAIFYDPKDSLPTLAEPLPQGAPLFIRNVNGILVAVTEDVNVNNYSLIFSVFDGNNFNVVKEYKKFNPDNNNVSFQDSSATVDDGCLYFSGRFCNEHGLFKFDPFTYQLTLESYYDNGGLSSSVSYSNSCPFLPTLCGGIITSTGNTIFNAVNNNYNSVSPEFRTKRFDAGSKNIKKKWLSVGISTHTDFDEDGSTPSTKTVTIYYRTDNNSGWTLLGVHTASSEPFTEFAYENTRITIQDYYTIQFKLVWSGLSYLDEFYVTHDGLPEIEN